MNLINVGTNGENIISEFLLFYPRWSRTFTPALEHWEWVPPVSRTHLALIDESELPEVLEEYEEALAHTVHTVVLQPGGGWLSG